ncbi:SCO6745 family protein [Streptomyces europaeiscabiei]|uniref:SCO6745 family protein n=1 Tax=Streptomyces europaeiscabiei TaxID=146819 RepID=UPI000E69D800|nr:hypothetical protein [Streptomyces europaeiscabiei]MDX2528947.1 hypothetical protein [Streptomyces europaeiscabiei]MDX2759376.1 hypothetical protein [Streptomyces europaeiscabiei]MDX3714525.1 hypothetical protein [Streptomyces europaeiscabiei]MDX3838622.1 hypothetical protein [Streptomyces europaeiscabiei]MDX3846813.1 hypothetical protein [Streptomyces europaeiscabiei]
MSAPAVARRDPARVLHDVLEPYHAVLYYAPQVYEAFRGVGLSGTWRGYFGGRAAPLGAVTAPVVTAAFYHFRPSLVAAAVPAVWETAAPEKVLAARLAGVDAALRAVLGDVVDGPELAEAASLATDAAGACTVPGRPLGGANAALEPPTAAHLALWQAATTLREFRGDGHVAALTHAGFDGVEALVSITAAGGEVRKDIQARRGWTDEEWAQGERRLRDRGLLDADGQLTLEGRVARNTVEELTDRFAAAPWNALGPAGTRRLHALLRPIGERVIDGLRLPLSVPTEPSDPFDS